MTGDHDDPDRPDRGPARPRRLDRRQALGLVGAVGVAGVLGSCSDDTAPSGPGPSVEATTTPPSTTTSPPAAPTTTAAAATGDPTADPGAAIPDETAGPFPADGTNGPDLLETDGVVRRDLTSSIGGLSGTADGVTTTIELRLVEATSGAPVPAAAVHLWHCTADGRYSVYEVTDQNFLRGVQEADDAGRVSFTSVFPGCYRGRWPHVHVQVFDSLEATKDASRARKVSQIALPEADCRAVYADARYGPSADHLAELSLDTDVAFRDGWSDQLATVNGTPDTGLTVSLLVRV